MENAIFVYTYPEMSIGQCTVRLPTFPSLLVWQDSHTNNSIASSKSPATTAFLHLGNFKLRRDSPAELWVIRARKKF